MSVETYMENNMTSSLASASLSMDRRGLNHYWLGLASLDDLKTNTLESAAGTLVSQYSGRRTIVYLLLQILFTYNNNKR